MVCLESLFCALSFACMALADFVTERVSLLREKPLGIRRSATRVVMIWLWAARLVFSSTYDSVVGAVLNSAPVSRAWYWIISVTPDWMHAGKRLAAGAGMHRIDLSSNEVHAGVHAHVMGSVGLDEHEVPLLHFAAAVLAFYVVRIILRWLTAKFFYSIASAQMILQRGLLAGRKVAEGDFSREHVIDRAFTDSMRLRADHGPMLLLLNALWWCGALPHFAFSALMWMEWAHAWVSWRVDAAMGCSVPPEGDGASTAAAAYWAMRSRVGLLTMRDTPSPANVGWVAFVVWLVEPALVPLAVAGRPRLGGRSD
jgi:hypothetical protein